MIELINHNPDTLDRLKREFQKVARANLSTIIGTNSVVGTPVANTNTQTSLSAGHAIWKTGIKVGKLFTVNSYGIYSTVGADLTLKLYAGTTLLISTGAVTLSAATNKFFSFKALVHGLATGVTGTVTAILEAANFNGTIIQKPGATVTLDTTIQHEIHLEALWSAADAGNTLTEQVFTVSD